MLSKRWMVLIAFVVVLGLAADTSLTASSADPYLVNVPYPGDMQKGVLQLDAGAYRFFRGFPIFDDVMYGGYFLLGYNPISRLNLTAEGVRNGAAVLHLHGLILDSKKPISLAFGLRNITWERDFAKSVVVDIKEESFEIDYIAPISDEDYRRVDEWFSPYIVFGRSFGSIFKICLGYGYGEFTGKGDDNEKLYGLFTGFELRHGGRTYMALRGEMDGRNNNVEVELGHGGVALKVAGLYLQNSTPNALDLGLRACMRGSISYTHALSGVAKTKKSSGKAKKKAVGRDERTADNAAWMREVRLQARGNIAYAKQLNEIFSSLPDKKAVAASAGYKNFVKNYKQSLAHYKAGKYLHAMVRSYKSVDYATKIIRSQTADKAKSRQLQANKIRKYVCVLSLRKIIEKGEDAALRESQVYWQMRKAIKAGDEKVANGLAVRYIKGIK